MKLADDHRTRRERRLIQINGTSSSPGRSPNHEFAAHQLHIDPASLFVSPGGIICLRIKPSLLIICLRIKPSLFQGTLHEGVTQ